MKILLKIIGNCLLKLHYKYYQRVGDIGLQCMEGNAINVQICVGRM